MSSNTTKPPVTFYDAMRAYMTGRQFVDVVSRNMEVLLDPRQPSPPAASNSTMTGNEDQDPLSAPAPAPIAPPPFPTPLSPDGQSLPQDPTTRAINAINDFTSILSHFGLRFGFTHWRDRFQRESAPLLSQLYNHASVSPHTSPPSQLPVQSPYQHQHQQQQWLSFSSATGPSAISMSMSMPIPPASSPLYPSSSPQFSHTHDPINLPPTTPPTTTYPPHPSPFSHSTSPYNNTAAVQYPQQCQQQQQQQDWHSSSPQHQQEWGSSPPPPSVLQQQQGQGQSQGLSDMPQPSGGRVRQVLAYGPEFTSSEGGQGQEQGQRQSWGG